MVTFRYLTVLWSRQSTASWRLSIAAGWIGRKVWIRVRARIFGVSSSNFGMGTVISIRVRVDSGFTDSAQDCPVAIANKCARRLLMGSRLESYPCVGILLIFVTENALSYAIQNRV